MVKGKSIISRCQWVPVGDELYQNYHDHEWGIPIHDDQLLFEFLILEGAQAGLSWITVLKRREEYRKAFSNFNPQVVAHYSESKIADILQNCNIIKNKLKVRSAVENAKHFLKIQEEYGSFDHYIWGFVENTPIDGQRISIKDVPPQTDISIKISKDLKKRGFTFVGPTIMYAFMQATGMVNDHTTDCFCYSKVKKLSS